MMDQAQLICFPTDAALAAAVADAWIGVVVRTQAVVGRHLVALSGGRVAKKFFPAAVQRMAGQGGSFAGVEFFWADERCVPADDLESNYLLADELLFKPGRVQRSSIHRIRGELDAEAAAKLATSELQSVYKGGPPPSLRPPSPRLIERGQGDRDHRQMPVLDLVLLGLGEDGHVASLFPADAEAGGDLDSVFRAVRNSPKPPPNRVTLGHGAIAAAREVWVLASGKGKEAALRESLSPISQTPLGRIIKNRATTLIFMDFQVG